MRDVPAREHHQRGEPEPVRLGEVQEVVPSARQVGAATFLRDRGAGDQASVEPHPEHLVGDGQSDHRGDDAGAVPPTILRPLHAEYEDEERRAGEHELRSYQPAEAEDDRTRHRHAPVRSARPVGEDPQAGPQPSEREPAFESTRRVDPHREHRDEDDGSEGKEERVARVWSAKSRRAPDIARPSPAAPNARPINTAIHSRRIGVTRSAIAKSPTQSCPVNGSARSPALNTGPLPARICRTTRR